MLIQHVPEGHDENLAAVHPSLIRFNNICFGFVHGVSCGLIAEACLMHRNQGGVTVVNRLALKTTKSARAESGDTGNVIYRSDCHRRPSVVIQKFKGLRTQLSILSSYLHDPPIFTGGDQPRLTIPLRSLYSVLLHRIPMNWQADYYNDRDNLN